MKTPITPAVTDLLYLCGRALAGEPADPSRVRQMNLAQVHALAASQSLSALAFYGLESSLDDAQPESTLLGTWRSERDRAIRRQMLFAAERAQICSWLTDNGVWHTPLKGSALESRYPHVGMREYCDNDILYDGTRRADVVCFFKERGYRHNADGHVAGIDDAFTKDPVYNFEMHNRLFSGYSAPEVAMYYDNVHSKLVRTDESPFSLRFTDEDLFLYLIAHSRKHFLGGGTGARILCDLEVFFAQVEDFDWGYVKRELNLLGMTDFAESLTRLSSCVFERQFDAATLSDEDAETLRALTSYGTYGTIDHSAELRIERERERGTTTGGYVRKRILPDAEWWEAAFPFAHKHKWARPAFLLFRTVRAALSPQRRRRIAIELEVLRRKSREDPQ